MGALTEGGRFEIGARSGVDCSVTGGRGVQRRPENYAPFLREEIVEIPCTHQEYMDFWYALNRQIGCGYSYRTILGLAFGREFRDRGRWDCSTLMAWCLLEAKMLPAVLREHLQQVTPNCLYAVAVMMAFQRTA